MELVYHQPMKILVAALLLLGACARTPATVGPFADGLVRPGVDVFLAEVPAALRGKRIGLIANHSAIDRAGRPAIDLVAEHKDLELVALFAPEHGIRGTAAAGDKIEDERDSKTGLPIYSLYKTEDRGPADSMLTNVDALVYDLQEVGGRTWTYVSTMALSMMAAKQRGIPFVVLDRPNPIGGEIVEGAPLDPKFKSFVGMYPIPARHGMTVGELATLFNTRFGIGANLIVIQAANWKRSHVVRRYWTHVGESVAEPPVAERAQELSRHRVLRRDEPHRGTRYGAAIRTGRRPMVERGGGRARDERESAAGNSLRGDHDGGRADRREAQGTYDSSDPFRDH